MSVPIVLAFAVLFLFVPVQASAQSCTAAPGAACTVTQQILIPPGTPPGVYLKCFEGVGSAHAALPSNQTCMTITVEAPPSDRDGDGVPDTVDQCPDLGGVAPSGCPGLPPPPGSDDVSRTFTLTSLVLPHKLVVDVPPWRCARWTGGSSVLRVTTVTGSTEKLLKSVAVPNPIKNKPFVIRCAVTATAVTLSLDGVVKVTVPAAP